MLVITIIFAFGAVATSLLGAMMTGAVLAVEEGSIKAFVTMVGLVLILPWFAVALTAPFALIAAIALARARAVSPEYSWRSTGFEIGGLLGLVGAIIPIGIFGDDVGPLSFLAFLLGSILCGMIIGSMCALLQNSLWKIIQ